MEAPKVIYWFILDEGTEWEESSYAEDEEPTSSIVSCITPFIPQSDYDALEKEANEMALYITGRAIKTPEGKYICNECGEDSRASATMITHGKRCPVGNAQRFLAEHKEDTK